MKKILIIFTIIFPMAFLTNCDGDNINCIDESGDIIEETFEVAEFSGVHISNYAKVYVSQQAEQELTIQAYESIIQNLLIYVKDETLVIENDYCTDQESPIIVNIKVPYINMIDLSGSGEIAINPFDNFDDLFISLSGSGDIYSVGDTLELDNLVISISGSGDAEFYLKADELDFTISGSGDITPRGVADHQRFIVSGSGNYYGFDLISRITDIVISGSGHCEVFTTEELDVKISGSGNVYYKGDPKITSEITGSGTIIDSN